MGLSHFAEKYPYYIVISGCRPGADAVRAVCNTRIEADAAFEKERAGMPHGKVDIVEVNTPYEWKRLQSEGLGWDAADWFKAYTVRWQPRIGASCAGGCYEPLKSVVF